MRASDIRRQKIVTATADLGDGDTITFQFDRNRITPAWVDEATSRDEDRDPLGLPKALASMLLTWDVTDDDGAPWPSTVENLSTIGFPQLSALVTRMVEAAAPTDAEGKASGVPLSAGSGISPQIQQTVPSPNGEQPSLLPTPSAVP